MRLKSFSITNFRSIKKLTIQNLGPINVFFGRNNVGKSNILRGLQLPFYCLGGRRIYLPDTSFYGRNIYKPIEVSIDAVFDEAFLDRKKLESNLGDMANKIRSNGQGRSDVRDETIGQIGAFTEMLENFKLPQEATLSSHFVYGDDEAAVTFVIKESSSKFTFDISQYERLYNSLRDAIQAHMREVQTERAIAIVRQLEDMGLPIRRKLERYAPSRSIHELIEYIPRERLSGVLHDSLGELEAPSSMLGEANRMISRLDEVLMHGEDELLKALSEGHKVVRDVLQAMCDSYILLPSRHFLEKGPIEKVENGKDTPIARFDPDGFFAKLEVLIGSPTKRQRALIHRFNSVFDGSFKDLGVIELTKFRNRVLAIFETPYISLPVEEQGRGLQDLFVYLAYMVLFEPAVIAIEEPEGGLSAKNQRRLREVMEDVYADGTKQIFMASHSEEFETANSYVIELDVNGTREISRRTQDEKYEQVIDKVLIKRNLEKQIRYWQGLLKETTEAQVNLDILNYVSQLGEGQEIDLEAISKELGYDKEMVEKVLASLTRGQK